jgi:transcriptional regulator with XRE-family HTH domain
MSDFGDALKAARKKAGKKLRETCEKADVSLSYMSDIEQGRRNPPPADIVKALEMFLGVDDGHLVDLAQAERNKRPTDLVQTMKESSRLTELFFRVRDLPDDKLKKLIDSLNED